MTSFSRPNCVICFSPIKDGIITPCCNVTCCEACLRVWLNTDRSCPQCRRGPLNISQTIPVNRVLERLNIGSEVYPPLPTSPTSKEEIPLHKGGGGVVGAPDALFTGAPVERALTERRCFYIFGMVFLGYAFITMLLMIVWKSAAKSPWDALSALMIFIFVFFLLVAVLIMLCTKCNLRADHKFYHHCCGALIIAAALVLAGLAIVGASMNAVHEKYTDAVFKMSFKDYADQFSIPLKTHVEELAGRQRVMAALFFVLMPFVVALAAVAMGYYIHAFDGARLKFALLSLGFVWPTLNSICGLSVCFSLGVVAHRAPSSYDRVFRDSVPTILTVSLITFFFLFIFFVMVCCWNRCGRDIVIEWKRFTIVLALASIAALVATFFQIATAYRKSALPYEGACDWSTLNNECEYPQRTDLSSFPSAVAILHADPTFTLPHGSLPHPHPHPHPHSPSPSYTHPLPTEDPGSSAEDCTRVTRHLFYYMYISEGHYLQPHKNEAVCLNLTKLGEDTHKQAVRGAQDIRLAAAWLSAYGVFVLALILSVVGCFACRYWIKNERTVN